jgi:lipooligosaccharide transport system permease protein
MLGTLGGVSYLAFVVPGMMAQAAMFPPSFETTVAAYSRVHLQRTWHAMLATPVRLAEILWGEIVWAASKGLLAAVCVLIVGWLWGGVVSPVGALLSLPVIMLACLAFAAFGLLATSLAKGWEFFSYFFSFWVTPMFLFCGVFFEISRFPPYLRAVVWLLPMTHLIAVIRPLVLAQPLSPGMALLHILYLGLTGWLAAHLALRRFTQRLFD